MGALLLDHRSNNDCACDGPLHVLHHRRGMSRLPQPLRHRELTQSSGASSLTFRLRYTIMPWMVYG
jgi:hypothetical protein